jgi:hypothetical protein
MRTDELIDVLSMDVQPVNRRQVSRCIGSAVTLGATAALGAVLLTIGVRPDLSEADALTFLALKLLFTGGIVVLASFYLIKVAHPGGERRTQLIAAVLPLIAILSLAVVSLAIAPSSQWHKMIVGEQWLDFLISIPVIATAPFVAIVWAVRRAAPTDLARTGAVSGLIVGAVSTTAYALHCTNDALPFVAVWYGGAITLCAFAGAKLGPRLLRW